MLLPLIINLLSELYFINEYSLVFVNEVKKLPDGSHDHFCLICEGSQIESKHFKLDEFLPSDNLYLLKWNEKNNIEHIIKLSPFLYLYQCDDCKTNQIFIFNASKGKHIEYLSYGCGHFYFPSTLLKDFEEILNIELSSLNIDLNIKDEKDIDYDELSLAYYTKGLQELSQKNFEESLNSLQVSLMYSERANTHFKAAIICLAIGRISDAIFHLKQANNINYSIEYSTLLKNIYEIIDESKIDTPTEKEKSSLMELVKEKIVGEEVIEKPKSLFFLLTPKKWKEFYYYFWFIIVISIIAIRIILTNLTGLSFDVSFLFYCYSILCPLTFMIFLTENIKNVYPYFLNQVNFKSRERFPIWYKNKVCERFGILPDNEQNNFLKNIFYWIKLNPIVSWGSIIVFILMLSTLGIILNYNNLSKAGIFIKYFEFITLCSIGAYPMWVGTITFVLMLEYSNWSIKPKVSKVNGYSLSVIIKKMNLLSIIIFSYLGSYLIYALTFSRYDSRIDIFTVGVVGTIGFSCWAIGIPTALYLALVKAKAKASMEFSNHQEIAFRKFLNEPTESNSEKYKWFKTQLREIQQISTNPMTFGGFIGVLFFVVFNFILCIGYIYIKLFNNQNEFNIILNKIYSFLIK